MLGPKKLMRAAVQAVKPFADRMPWLAGVYRDLRERLPNRFGDVVQTPLGFAFAGYPQMQAGEWEPLETAFIESELSATDVFVDVGANIGYYTCLARARGVYAIAVEPLETNLSALYKNITSNQWRDRVEVLPFALSASPGLLELYGTNTGASLIRGWSGTSSSNVRTVPVSTLDILLAHRFDGARMLLKVDVEGVEHEVLRGASAVLARKPAPHWIVEVCLTEHQDAVNPHFREVFEAFWNNGYQALTLEERRAITPADVDEWIATGRRTFGSYSVLFLPR